MRKEQKSLAIPTVYSHQGDQNN